MINWDRPIQEMLDEKHVMESAHYVYKGDLYSVKVQKLKRKVK